MKSTVFLSYSSSLSEAARRIELTLQGEGFSVFRDRSMLPPGESFDARIRTAIEDSDLFVFLINPESVSPGRYTLTELKFAEQKWQHPAGRVLPVFAEATPKGSIPAYLRAVTILQPRGDLVAEVAAEVVRLSRPWWRRMLEPRRLLPALFVALLVAGVAWMGLPASLERRGQNAEARALIAQSQSQADAGEPARAWTLLEQANAVAPASHEVFEAQERLAMTWLREAGLSPSGSRGSASVEALVRTTLPVLSRGISGADGERLANLLAHRGWADHLRGGGAGSGESDPATQYRRALEVDPDNVYAHAMWGFEILSARRSPEALAEARPHFSAALRSRRERDYVRSLQLSALLQTDSHAWVEDPERHAEAIRVANEMRVHGEAQPKAWGPGSLQGKVWAIYHFGFIAGDAQAPLLAALPPAEHLASFHWWYPEADVAGNQGGPSLFDHLTVLAPLQEHAGDRAGAIASYRRLLDEFASRKYDSDRAIKIADRARAALQRLAGERAG